MESRSNPTGRFAPSPSGRMHLGNLFTALLSWLSVKSRGGKWILRIEDLDPQRSKLEYARLIEDDLMWLGLEWDEGGIDGRGPNGPYRQSMRSDIYNDVLARLDNKGLLYGCRCRRADIMATQAPHQSDGRIVYAGTCRPAGGIPFPKSDRTGMATRIYVPDSDICFSDLVYGPRTVNLAGHCGDFVLQRADGAWAYQLAVVADDALMGVTEVMRGVDLLLSAAQQIYLYRMLGFEPPSFAHVPLIADASGRRLSKRDSSLAADELRRRYSPRQLLGIMAALAGLISEPRPVGLDELLEVFDHGKIEPLPYIDYGNIIR